MARTPLSPAQQQLVDRVREHLADEPMTRELSMFGGRWVLVAGKIFASAGKDGGLLLRVAADDDEELLSRPGAARAEMGVGRDMGPGWINVAASAVETDEGLNSWLEPAMAYNRSVTGRAARRQE